MSESEARLDVVKALGDNTRYASYLELARSPRPLSTTEMATSLALHVNTVRPHLERMRDTGLLEVFVDARGGVGRPQHRYSLAADAPSLGLEPPVFPLATALLLRLAAEAGAGAEEARETGRDQGRVDGSRSLEREAQPCAQALVERLATLGFDPAVVETEEGVTVAFTHCPFRELAEANPDLVCGLHRGLVEGFVEAFGGDAEVGQFRSLVDRAPCEVDLRLAPEEAGV